ncbi:MAG: thiol peroxidase [Bacillota bacterium]
MSVTFAGQPVTLKGETRHLGDEAPLFKAVDRDLNTRSLEEFLGSRYTVLSVVPSIDTGVCDYQTKHFNKTLNDVEGVNVVTISNDLPFAQKRWCGSEGLENIVTLSDHKDLDFAMKYGTLMEEYRLQARAVFILDANRKIVHVEYVNEVTEHPDYDSVVELVKE